MVFNFTYKLNVLFRVSTCSMLVWSICISTSVSLLFGLIPATLYWISFLVLYLRLIFMELYVDPEVQCYPDSDTRGREGEAVWNCCCWLYWVIIFLNIGYDKQYMHLMFTQILTIPAFSVRTTLTVSNMNAMRPRPYEQQSKSRAIVHEYGILRSHSFVFLVYFAFLLSDDVSNPCFRF